MPISTVEEVDLNRSEHSSILGKDGTLQRRNFEKINELVSKVNELIEEVSKLRSDVDAK